MEYVQVLLPSVAVGVIFWFVIRKIFAIDRAEREALAQHEQNLELEHDRHIPVKTEPHNAR